MERRLAAILAADIVGYSRLMSEDEAATLARLRRCDNDIIGPIVAKYGGRVFKRMGDGFLVEFSSVVAAMECALAWQQATKQDDSENPFRFRIGVTLGDVMVESDDVFGDGVNIAARLEGLAGPGQIYASAAAFDQIKNKLSVSAERLGPRALKNISDPVVVYRIEPADEPRGRRGLRGGDVVQRPAVAVLPFVNLGADIEQEYFADGLTEDIIAAVSAWHLFPVTSRQSSFAFKGTSLDLKRVAGELGARYVLQGSVRKNGPRVRITATLTDATSDTNLWAARHDMRLDDIFELQDEITQRIAATLAPEVEKAEAKRAVGRRPETFEAWDCYQRGTYLLAKFTKAGNEEARRMFQMAIDADPHYSKAYSGLAYSHHRDISWNYADDRDSAIAAFLAAARRAVELDDRDSSAQLVLGYANLWVGKYDLSVAALGRAVQLHPGNAFAHVAYGEALDLSGRPQAGIPEMERGLDLNWDDPRIHTFIGALARAYLNARQYEEAENWALKALERRPDYPQAQLYLASALGHLGQTEEARAVLEGCPRLLPGFALIYRQDADNEHVLDGLRKAGWCGSVKPSGDLTHELGPRP